MSHHLAHSHGYGEASSTTDRQLHTETESLGEREMRSIFINAKSELPKKISIIYLKEWGSSG